jgi:hypothetical protein
VFVREHYAKFELFMYVVLSCSKVKVNDINILLVLERLCKEIKALLPIFYEGTKEIKA